MQERTKLRADEKLITLLVLLRRERMSINALARRTGWKRQGIVNWCTHLHAAGILACAMVPRDNSVGGPATVRAYWVAKEWRNDE